MDLKWFLVCRIVLLALICFCVGSAIVIGQTIVDVRKQNEQLAEMVSHRLELQLLKMQNKIDLRTYPDWDLVASFSLQPGQCVQLMSRDGSAIRKSCADANLPAISPPAWFEAIYTLLLNVEASALRRVFYQGQAEGIVIAKSNSHTMAQLAWKTIAPMLGMSAGLIASLCILTYWVIDRALAPTKEILSGLNTLAQGDLDCRLPAFRLAELNRISEVFNALSCELSKVMADRAELARKLVDAQEQERLHIARELHDDVAQQLSGINAVAACVRRKINREDPTAARDASELEAMTSESIVSLRKTLAYLRPSEIDDLGLLQSLRDLVEKHNNIAQGATHFSLEAHGDLTSLSKEASAHVYRIIQEALTNAAKHAQASRVEVRLNKYRENDADKIELVIADDGCGMAAQGINALNGWGMIGMRERVLALSGRFAAGPNPSGGFGLRVEFSAQAGSR